MTRHKKFQILAAAAVLCINGPVQADEGERAPPAEDAPKSIPFEKGPYEVRVERSHFIETRDGVRLMTDLYFPEGHEGRLPVILERTPYNKATHRNSDPDEPINSRSIGYYFASHGYVVAVQDRRGKFESEGDYTIGYGDVNDAGDTLDWFEKQAWFNGRVGMIGCSVPGGNVVKAAMSRHKTLKGLVPQSAAFGHGTAGGTMARGFIRGGVQNMDDATLDTLLGFEDLLSAVNASRQGGIPQDSRLVRTGAQGVVSGRDARFRDWTLYEGDHGHPAASSRCRDRRCDGFAAVGLGQHYRRCAHGAVLDRWGLS